MWRSLWRSIDRFSVQEFKYLINELQEVKVVDKLDKEFVVDILRSIVEIVIYGDRRDPSIFEYFMECQILAEFLRILKISRNSGIEAQLLHYLGIMIQNLDSEHAIYYCFSNEYINSIILQPYEFDAGDLAHYYISFLRAVSGKLNRDTICLLVKVQEDTVVSFPLYTEALKLAWHEEKMIQIAVRALTLSIYNVSDDMVLAFITTPPVSEYFSGLVLNLKEQCYNLDALVSSTKDNYTYKMRKGLLLEAEKVVDDLYYFKDVLRVGEPRLSTLMIEKLLSLFVLPVLLPSLLSNQTTELQISSVTSLYIISRLLQVVDAKELVNSVASALLNPHTVLSMSSDRDIISTNPANSFLGHLNEVEDNGLGVATPESGRTENSNMNYLSDHSSEDISSSTLSANLGMDNLQTQSDGILALILSGNHTLLLAFLMFLLVLSESKDLEDSLSLMMGIAQNKIGEDKVMEQASHIPPSHAVGASIFARHMPQILTALLKILVSQPQLSILTLWNTGWILRKLLVFQEKKLTDQDFDLLNLSCKDSCDMLLKEVNRSWFDYIPVTLKSEWENCKTALEESSQSKDPFFFLEPALDRHIPDGDIPSSLAWKRMVGVVKPMIDENHPTWLHLRVREYDPMLEVNKTGRYQSVDKDRTVDRKWTLGFPNDGACEAARSLILKEISMQRLSVESLLAPLLHSSAKSSSPDCRGE
ncbi:protein TRANSPARENT TESTA 9-like isoform X2 [Tasmannia lanceolata]|uniref:protein TRANSPARENT TESTA 9-like isoform X2 n=1 Tax=Tasmannia lanceolata TaxID=3420 RepID=UPI004063ADEB